MSKSDRQLEKEITKRLTKRTLSISTRKQLEGLLKTIKKRNAKNKIINAAIIILLLSSSVFAQPHNTYVADWIKTQVAWIYTCNTNCPIKGFHIYCDDASNKDAIFTYYRYMIDVPDRTARNYLVGPTISEIMNPVNIDTLVNIQCKVVPYNNAGEAESGLSGVPNPITFQSYFITRSQ